MNIQSDLARELLEQAVDTTSLIGKDSEIRAALNTLRDMVGKQSSLKPTTDYPQPFFPEEPYDIDEPPLQRPPWLAIKEVLDQVNGMH